MLMLLVAAIGVIALSGLPALVVRGRAGEYASTALVLIGSIAGLVAATSTLLTGNTLRAAAPWRIPNAELALRLDPLAAAFLLPSLALGALASIYGLGYWPAHEQHSAGRVRAFTGILVAGMATVVIAAHAVVFLVAWEAMAVAAFFLIAAEDENGDVRSAAWIYLIATHVGTLFLFGLFAMMRAARGTFLLGPLPPSTGALVASAILLLAILGFGFKAGIVPLHFWLPGAHANAPSHVSAMLSGAMLKVGVYGIVRVIFFLPDPRVWWGGLLIALGLTSALVAIGLAIAQSDMKRSLAYSSIENVGIITVAIGLGTIGRASGSHMLEAIGFAAAIAHVWNHAIFKGLLFMGAGSVLHATGTRNLEKLGGLLKAMPVTGTVFIVGAGAASALPSLNAFVSEWLLYVGLVGQASKGAISTLAAAVIALVGALAVVCFVRLVSSIFLGAARTDAPEHAHEAGALMLAPMFVLALACAALGIYPAIPVHALETITRSRGQLAPLFRGLSAPLQMTAALTAIVLFALIAKTRTSPRRPTWDCGYAAPTARMQYTAGSLAEWFTSRLLPPMLRPMTRIRTPDALLPVDARLETTIDEPFGDRVFRPLAERWGRRAMRVRWMQQGRLPLYLLYIYVTLLALVGWVLIFPAVSTHVSIIQTGDRVILSRRSPAAGGTERGEGSPAHRHESGDPSTSQSRSAGHRRLRMTPSNATRPDVRFLR